MRKASELFATDIRDLRDLILNLITDSKSMWHPLGFVSCTIIKDDTGVLKLHYWPANDRREKRPNWPIHDHAFHIHSQVLLGRVMSNFYDVSPGSDYRRYYVGYEGSDSILVPTDDLVDCELAERTVQAAGDRYEIAYKRYHENVVAAASEAMTLVYKEPPSSNEDAMVPPNVIGTIKIPNLPMYQRTEYSSDTILNVFKSLF
ncbi:MAG: hypothetical protein AAGI08_04625 [Bacteroidota bacterium]